MQTSYYLGQVYRLLSGLYWMWSSIKLPLKTKNPVFISDKENQRAQDNSSVSGPMAGDSHAVVMQSRGSQLIVIDLIVSSLGCQPVHSLSLYTPLFYEQQIQESILVEICKKGKYVVKNNFRFINFLRSLMKLIVWNVFCTFVYCLCLCLTLHYVLFKTVDNHFFKAIGKAFFTFITF